MTITASFIDRLKSQISVSDLVSKRVKLSKKGKDYFGRCPFHNESTPSFSVNDTKRFYHCFGCGANGDVISFIEKTQNLDFHAAVKYLAEEYKIPMPEIDTKRHKIEAAIEKINEVAAKWFHRNLYSDKCVEHIKYLNNRGINNAAIKKFFIGYAPHSQNSLIQYLRSVGYSDADIKTSGLVTIIGTGEMLDKFRGRIIFPIANIRGKILGFGGRALKDVQPKYLNSPETDIFKKKYILYNENNLFKSRHSNQDVYVVEGYTDVISVFMAGIESICATLGTAVSEFHIQKLWKISDSPTICMDGDAAGTKAMNRAIDVVLPILKPGYSISFVQIPKGMDPDDVIKTQGSQALLKIFEKKIDLCEAIWNLKVSQADIRTPEKQALFKKELADMVDQIQDFSVRKFYHKYFNNRVYNFLNQTRWKTFDKKKTINKEEIKSVAQQFNLLDKNSLTLMAIIINYPYILTQEKIHEEFFSIDLGLDYCAQVHLAIATTFDEIDAEANEKEFNKKFRHSLNAKLDPSVIEYLCGRNSYFLDKIGVKNINNVVTSWSKTFARYNLELLKADYVRSLQSMDESSVEASGRLKKQILEQEDHIKNNSN
ncbi:MAG: DNA primase [Alphaproteobacteria bacterium]|nr:DNA primase [Alphaproteobacteria bacterium]